MNRAAYAVGLASLWLLLMVVGAWLLQFTLLGILAIIIGALGFVLTFASSLPQSTLHARDE